jgi:hypothetical protein
MVPVKINNFWEKDPIYVSDTGYFGNGRRGVGISQCAGSMTFTHTLTCEQARQLAQALLATVAIVETAKAVAI